MLCTGAGKQQMQLITVSYLCELHRTLSLPVMQPALSRYVLEEKYIRLNVASFLIQGEKSFALIK